MNELFAPSLPLLLIKTALIFGISWVAGWTVCAKRVFENDFLNWTLRLITGVAFLNICVVNASIWGSTGQVGMLAALAALIARIIVARGQHKSGDAARLPNGKRVAAYAGICLLASCNYLLPFIVENTSGYYSRSGGDHSTYLALSDYFVSQKLYKKIDKSETVPPRPYWEINNFIRTRQVLKSKHAQPLTNQYIATPFVALFPGSREETYTAVVAFYFTLAVWGAVGLVGVMTGARHRHLAIAAGLVALSNLLIFTASQHAIPFLFATGLMNTLLAFFIRKIAAGKWSLLEESNLAAFALAGALLLIYPHLFLFGGALLGVVMVMYFKSVKESLLAIRLGVVTILTALLLTNVSLYITVPLVQSGATGVSNMASSYTAKEFLSVQSGIVDFGMYLVPGLAGKDAWSNLGISRLVVLVIFALIAIWHARWRAGLALLALISVVAIATVYFVHKGLFYQATRFSQTGHLLYLSLAGVGIAWACTHGRAYFALAGVVALGLAAHAFGRGRLFTLKEVTGIIDSYQVEFRRAGHLRIAKVLAEQSNAAGGRTLYWLKTAHQVLRVSDKDFATNRDLIPAELAALPGGLTNITFFTEQAHRIVYYFGPGYGVDLAGATLLLRWSSYLMAHGYDYTHLWDENRSGFGARLWSEPFLTNCLLAVQAPRGNDVITDKRDSTTPPKWRIDNLAVYDTQVQNAAEIIGEAWNATQYQGDQPYRYLQGRPGALVIWSQKDEAARLSTLVHANQDMARLIVSGLALKEALTFDLQPWKGVRDPSQAHTIPLNLKQGPNVILFAPDGSLPAKPSPIFWSLNICSGGGDQYCEGAPLKTVIKGESASSSAKVASAGTPVQAGQSVEATWRGIDSAAKDDWIGVFMVGGADSTRVAFHFTKGGKSGKLSIPLPLDVAPGTYELRFFSKGGWAMLASSPPFPVLNPNYKKPEKK